MNAVELSDAEKSSIFTQDVLPDLIADEEGRQPPLEPQFVILGGQPGSGKTGVLDATRHSLQEQGATWAINADDFAAYHPLYVELQARHGLEAADMVRAVTGQWIQAAIAEAQARRVNVVFESTMRQTAVVEATLSQFTSLGYSTHAKVLAVRPMESWQGNHYRREQLAAAGSLSRLASRESHDAAVSGSLTTVRQIQEHRLATRMTIVDRSDVVLYESVLTERGWSNPALAVDTLAELRQRPMSPSEATLHLERWTVIEKLARERHNRSSVSERNDAAARAEMVAISGAKAADVFRLVVEGGYSELRANAMPAVGEALSAMRAAQSIFSRLSPDDQELRSQLNEQARDSLQAKLAAGQVKDFLDLDRLAMRVTSDRSEHIEREI
ncbi:zeta toxin family protein [Stenotrophomonas oahuensis]|uniref:Zeta toxin family protein n=1 Tax=Stenotrophomonas oahuensis TaxID=3003271 RepID=A0ABY9YWA0_9GAMM|nr:zeta toxin family protein [Stenotrophomonas sp. A5586]WNH54840.1 zeta toxin family protein [Stenotrophomonas sp. A5586]